jgi:hypothetical protein
MYITDIHLEGVGPLPNLQITPRFRPDGTPVPVVLVGQNGSGKSLTLAVLLDAMIEAKKKAWRKIPEVVDTQFLRIMSTNYVRVGSDYSLSQLKFKSGTMASRTTSWSCGSMSKPSAPSFLTFDSTAATSAESYETALS